MASSSKRPFPEDMEEEEEEEEGKEKEEESTASLAPQPKRPRLCPLCSRDPIISLSDPKVLHQLSLLFRRVVEEELPKQLHKYFRPSPRLSINQTHEPPKFKLQFLNKLPPKLFVDKGIRAEDETPIQIAIMHANTNEIVTSEPWASVNVKIVPLRGDFNPEERGLWSKEEFDNHIESERSGKPPLLMGGIEIRLCNGVGCIGHANFTDNSRSPSGKFRLGAVVSPARERVQEAVSEAVVVKDARVESRQKDGPPSLDDGVFRLRKIRERGVYHQRLMSENICTVQDFLRSYVMNRDKLYTLLKMPKKFWQVTIAHAQQCNLGDKLFSYHVPEKEIVLIFNTIFEVVQVKIGGQNHTENDLSISQKMEVNYYKNLAYENPKDMHEFHETAIENVYVSRPTLDISTISETALFDPIISDYPTTILGASSRHMGFQHQYSAPQNAVSSDAFQPALYYTTFPEVGSSSRQVPGDMCSLHATVIESLDVSLTAVDVAAVPGSSLPEPLNSNHPISFPDASSSQLNFLSSELQLESDPLFQFRTIDTGGSLLSPSDACAILSAPGPSSYETSHIQDVLHDISAGVVPSTPDSVWPLGSTNSYNADDVDQWINEYLASSPPSAEITKSAGLLYPRKWVKLRVAIMLVFAKG